MTCRHYVARCSFCTRPLRRTYGINFFGRADCRRWRCYAAIWWRRRPRLRVRIERRS